MSLFLFSVSCFSPFAVFSPLSFVSISPPPLFEFPPASVFSFCSPFVTRLNSWRISFYAAAHSSIHLNQSASHLVNRSNKQAINHLRRSQPYLGNIVQGEVKILQFLHVVQVLHFPDDVVLEVQYLQSSAVAPKGVVD